jgi:hypothetical protein
MSPSDQAGAMNLHSEYEPYGFPISLNLIAVK